MRPFRTDDLDGMTACYRAMLAEYADRPDMIHYPQTNAETPDEMAAQVLQGVWQGGGRWYGAVAVQDDTVIGMAFGEVYPRPVGRPKTVGHLYCLYVAPGYRGGAGRRSVAMGLMRQVNALATADHPDLVLEASAATGSRQERVWRGLGFRPYQTLMAWAHADGTPRRAAEFFRKESHDG